MFNILRIVFLCVACSVLCASERAITIPMTRAELWNLFDEMSKVSYIPGILRRLRGGRGR